jgi:hypothetical protein
LFFRPSFFLFSYSILCGLKLANFVVLIYASFQQIANKLLSKISFQIYRTLFLLLSHFTTYIQLLGQTLSNCVPPPPGGVARPLGEGARVVCVRDIFILNEVWAQHKTYIFRHISWMTYFTHHFVPVLAPNYKQLTLSSAKLRWYVIY